jgi:mRNA interferase RelE/StbE
MPYRIDFAPAASRQLRALPRLLQIRIGSRIDALATTPRPRGVKRLRVNTLYRIRIGDYRVMYNIKDDEQVIEVALVKHRREAY